MCWFVTAAVPAKEEPTFRARARAAQLQTDRQENASLTRALAGVDRLPADLPLWSVTRGQCSCDLVIGASVDRKLRGAQARKRTAEIADAPIGLRAEVRELLGAIAELGSPLAFVIHTYSGTLDESFDMVKGPRFTPEEIRADVELRWDAIYVVRTIARHGSHKPHP